MSDIQLFDDKIFIVWSMDYEVGVQIEEFLNVESAENRITEIEKEGNYIDLICKGKQLIAKPIEKVTKYELTEE